MKSRFVVAALPPHIAESLWLSETLSCLQSRLRLDD